MQICGFAVGGLLVATLSARGALLAGAAAYLIAAAIARFGLSRRPPRTAGRPSVGQTWRNNARLWSSAPRRYVYLALWVPNGLIVGCESLFVPYAPRHAGLLFASAALGMLAGDTLTGRFIPPRWQGRLSSPLRLLLQQRLMALTPDDLSGHALGLHSSGTLTMQGVGAAIAGAVAVQTSPGTAMAVMAAASVAVTVILAPGLRPGRTPPQPGEPGDQLQPLVEPQPSQT